MNKFDRLKTISNRAADQASEDCASKIKRLTGSQLDTIIEELEKNCVNGDEVDRLCREIKAATDKNQKLQVVVRKSENICRAVAEILECII